MSAPRRVVPGQTWFLTRRTVARFFLLNPDRARIIVSLYWYITAVVAAKYGIQLHAVQILSTHIHEVVTDPHGQLPRFLRDRNRLFALALKAWRGIDGPVFAGCAPSCVALYGEAAVMRQIAYTLANCVEAGLARSPEAWVGVTMSAADIGVRRFEAERPPFFFNPENPQWPAHAHIDLTMPSILESAFKTVENARARLCEAVDRAVELARRAVTMRGRSFANPSRIYRADIWSRAKSREPARERVPAFAAGGVREHRMRAVDDHRSFLEAYRAAFRRLKAGLREIAFPFGTWRYCRELGFRMATAPSTLSNWPAYFGAT